MLKTLKHLPLVWKIFVPFGLIVLISTAVTLILLSSTHNSEQFFKKLSQNNMQYNLHLSNLEKLFTEHHLMLMEHVSAKASGTMVDLAGRIKQIQIDVQGILLAHAKQHGLHHESPIAHLRKLYEMYQIKAEEVMELSREFEKEKSFKILQTEAAPLFREIGVNIYNERFATDKMNDDFYLQAAQSHRNNTILAWCFITASIVISALIAFLLAKYVSFQMNTLMVYAKAIGEGNLDATLNVTAADEFGRLGNSLKTMAGNISSSFNELHAVNEQLERQATELEMSDNQLKLRQHELEGSNKILQKMQSTFNNLMIMTLEAIPLDELLQNFIEQITFLPELNLSNKGAIFIIEKEPDLLVLKGSYNLATPLHEICKTVPFGRCLCGRVAKEGRVIFTNCVDHRHDNTYDGISPHGHYCVPIYMTNHKLCGVFTVYVEADTAHSQRVEDFLVSAASILGSVIQHRQSEDERKESNEIYRAITDTANDAIIMIDEAGKTVFWNPSASNIFGYGENEVIGKDLHDLISPKEYHDLARKGMAEFNRTGQGNAIGNTVELKGRRKDGTEFPIELSLAAVLIKGKRVAVGVVRDLSERKVAEADKVKLQTQLRQAQKMESIGTLAGGIAHDFNNILTAVLGFASLAKAGVEHDPQTTEDIDQVIIAGNRAKSLVKQILTFSRQTDQELMPLQISPLVKETLKFLRASIPTTIEIKQNILSSEATVLADPTQIHQIIMNMCTNAYQAMRNGGVLEVTLDDEQPDVKLIQTNPDMEEGPFLCLRIADTGSGMDSATLSRIFEPYFSTKKKEDGTGLGLSVVHGIVVGMGGGIRVASRIGEGTTFSIYLPLVTEEYFTESKDQVPVPTGTEHIFYVDDEMPIVVSSKRRLERLGYMVSTRTSSIEALAAFRDHPDRFDLVITDHNMPNMDGITLAEEMRKIRPDMPIILSTGFHETDLDNKSRNPAITEVLLKPTSKEKLAITIRKILDGIKSKTC